MNFDSSKESNEVYSSSNHANQNLIPVLQELYDRGYIHQCTDLQNLNKLLAKKSDSIISCYVGFDCTAKSLHVGSLMQIMIMRLMQKHGYKPIILLGGATTLIGDPSDKDEMRKMRSSQEIEENKTSIAKIFYKLLEYDGKSSAVFVDNKEWLQDIKYLDFLRNYGRYFSINRMLTFDSVRIRLERQQPLTFLEFNYMLLQAYDFVELYRRYNCHLQFGGSEQWSNILSGIDLGRRVENCELFGITTPLVTTEGGVKMGKTVSGAIWLNDDMISSYDFWQFWRNTPDIDVIKFLKIYTDLSLNEIDDLENSCEINDIKIILANQVTALCHGQKAAELSAKTAEETFNNKEISDNLPKFFLTKEELPTPLYKLLVLSRLCESNSSAKKLILGKGARINHEIIDDENFFVTIDAFDNNCTNLMISSGKKRHAIITLQ